MKAYFKGLGMDGIRDISDIKPNYRVVVPRTVGIKEEQPPEKGDEFPIATFAYKGHIPIYELESIK